MGTNNRPKPDLNSKHPLITRGALDGYPLTFRRSVPKLWLERSDLERFLTHLRRVADCFDLCVDENDHKLRLLAFAEIVQWSICAKKWSLGQWEVWVEQALAYRYNNMPVRPQLTDHWRQRDWLNSLTASEDLKLNFCRIIRSPIGIPRPVLTSPITEFLTDSQEFPEDPTVIPGFPPTHPPPTDIFVNHSPVIFQGGHGDPKISEPIFLGNPNVNNLILQVIPRVDSTILCGVEYQISTDLNFTPVNTFTALQDFTLEPLIWTEWYQKTPDFIWPQILSTELQPDTTYYLRWRLNDCVHGWQPYSDYRVVISTVEAGIPVDVPPVISNLFASATPNGLGGPPVTEGPFLDTDLVYFSVFYEDSNHEPAAAYKIEIGNTDFSTIFYDSGIQLFTTPAPDGSRTENVSVPGQAVGNYRVRFTAYTDAGAPSNSLVSDVVFDDLFILPEVTAVQQFKQTSNQPLAGFGSSLLQVNPDNGLNIKLEVQTDVDNPVNFYSIEILSGGSTVFLTTGVLPNLPHGSITDILEVAGNEVLNRDSSYVLKISINTVLGIPSGPILIPFTTYPLPAAGEPYAIDVARSNSVGGAPIFSLAIDPLVELPWIYEATYEGVLPIRVVDVNGEPLPPESSYFTDGFVEILSGGTGILAGNTEGGSGDFPMGDVTLPMYDREDNLFSVYFTALGSYKVSFVNNDQSLNDFVVEVE